MTPDLYSYSRANIRRNCTESRFSEAKEGGRMDCHRGPELKNCVRKGRGGVAQYAPVVTEIMRAQSTERTEDRGVTRRILETGCWRPDAGEADLPPPPCIRVHSKGSGLFSHTSTSVDSNGTYARTKIVQRDPSCPSVGIGDANLSDGGNGEPASLKLRTGGERALRETKKRPREYQLAANLRDVC
jgi:hypothetical protein